MSAAAPPGRPPNRPPSRPASRRPHADPRAEPGETTPARPSRVDIREEVLTRPSRAPSIREEVLERPSRPPAIREETHVRRTSSPAIRQEVVARPSRAPAIREEVLERPSRAPAVREEVLERPSRAPAIREEVLERPARTPIAREEMREPPSRAPIRRDDDDDRPPARTPPPQRAEPSHRPSRPEPVEDETPPQVVPVPTPPPPPAPVAAPAPAVAPTPAPPPAPAPPPVVRPANTPGSNRIDRFLKLMNDRGASDLHLSVGRAPIFRLGGRMEPIRYRTLDDTDFKVMIEPITPHHIWDDYVVSGDADFAYEVPGLSRFRVNLFRQERGMGAVFRIIPTRLMTVHQLGLPEAIRKVVDMRSGLVLVTGPTGSGKSTTLSAIINEMNEKRPMHFVTIEDPIEFVHPNKKSLMTQREIGPHSKSFSTALRAAVREDPDAILVGEMRDLETIGMALSAAETGVLVFGTLHTNSAAKTIDRIINVFPADKQPGVRGTLASVMKCVVAQQLLRKKGGGRVAAVEIMFGSQAMGSMIREGKTNQLSGLIKLGKKDGMIAMDDALKKLIEADVIEPLAGLEKSLDKDEFRKWLKEQGTDVPDGESKT